MKEFQKQFYATREDLLPRLRRADAETFLQYIQRGMFPSPKPTVYLTAAEIPDLGFPRYGDRGDTFLVFKMGTRLVAEEIPQLKGGVLYDIGLSENLTAFAFQPGGQFGDNAIITGSVDTATGDPTSLALCRWFWKRLSKGFTKVQGYYIGPEAYRLFQQGWRLTDAVQSPPEFDLRL